MEAFRNVINSASTAVGLVNDVMGFGSSFGTQSTMGLNENLYIVLQDKESGDSVRGRIVSYSISNQSEWANKFEGMDGDSRIPIMSALLQSGAYSDDIEILEALNAKTLITKAQSIQVWTGLLPQSISLEIEFRAFSDPVMEVEEPIQKLLKMMSPVLENTSIKTIEKITSKVKDMLKNGTTADAIKKITEPFGDVPSEIAIAFFRKRFNATYRIESMEENVDEVRIDARGNRIYQVVSLTLGSTKGIVKDDVEPV